MTISTDSIRTSVGTRRIEYIVPIETREDGTVAELSISVSHDKGGSYRVSIWRHLLDGMFVTISLMDDCYERFNRTEGARYSNKNLDKFAAMNKEWLIDALEHNTELIEWVKQVKTR